MQTITLVCGSLLILAMVVSIIVQLLGWKGVSIGDEGESWDGTDGV